MNRVFKTFIIFLRGVLILVDLEDNLLVMFILILLGLQERIHAANFTLFWQNKPQVIVPYGKHTHLLNRLSPENKFFIYVQDVLLISLSVGAKSYYILQQCS